MAETGSDRILKILLKLSADTAGATQTTEALKQVDAQAAKTGATVQGVGASTSSAAELATGLLAGAFTAAGYAALAIYNHISNAVEAEKRLNEEVARQNLEIDRAVTNWLRLADTAENIGSQVKIADKAEAELSKLSDKMAEFRRRELDAFGSWSESNESLLRNIITLGGHIPGISTQTTGQQKAAAGLAATQRAVEVAVRDTNTVLNIAAEKTREWLAATANLPRGIETYTQKVAEAQKKLDDITAKAQASPTDNNLLGLRQDALHELDDAQHKLEQLAGEQAKLALATDRVADAIMRANFEHLDPAHKLFELEGEVMGLQGKLLELGVAAESPNEAFAKATELINSGTLATQEDRQEVLRLVGAWAQVLGMISQAVDEQNKMAGAVASLEQHLATVNATAYGSRDEAYKAEWGEKYNKILAERQRIGASTSASEINAQISAEQAASERKKGWAEEDRASGKAISGHQEVNALLREQSSLIESIHQKQQLIDANPFLTPDAKAVATLSNIQQEMAALYAQIQADKAKLLGGALDPQTYARIDAELQKLQHNFDLLSIKTQALKLPLQAELATWVNSFGGSSHQIAQTIQGSIGTALQGVNSLLLSAGDKSTNWKQALVGVEKQIAGTFLTMLENMALQQVAQLLHITTTTTAQTASGAAIAAAHAPAAAATSISSYGVAALVGEVLAVAAIAAIMAALSGGLAEGGRVPGSPSRRDNLIMGMATGETVISAPASQGWDNYFGGQHWHQDMNQMRVPVARGLAGGGRVDIGFPWSGANSQDKVDTHEHYIFFDEADLWRSYHRSDASTKHVVQVVRNNKPGLGIRS